MAGDHLQHDRYQWLILGPVYLLLSPVSLLMVIFFGDHMIKSFRYDSNELSSNTVAMTTVILLLYGTML